MGVGGVQISLGYRRPYLKLQKKKHAVWLNTDTTIAYGKCPIFYSKGKLLTYYRYIYNHCLPPMEGKGKVSCFPPEREHYSYPWLIWKYAEFIIYPCHLPRPFLQGRYEVYLVTFSSPNRKKQPQATTKEKAAGAWIRTVTHSLVPAGYEPGCGLLGQQNLDTL